MEEKVYLIRINFQYDETYIEDFNRLNQIAILVDQDDEKEVLENYIKENKSKKKIQYIDRWISLQNNIIENDVLILATYKNNPIAKVGRIKKGTAFFNFSKDENYKIFQLEKETVKSINLSDYPIFSSIIPSQVTISPIRKRVNVVRHLFHFGNLDKLELALSNISEKLVELLCVEWLRSDLAKENQIKYQLLLTGGNLANIDILGITINEKCLAAQVTDTSDKKTIELKIKKLKNSKSDIKLLFCNNILKTDPEIQIISLQKVWDELMNNGYERMLETMVRQ